MAGTLAGVLAGGGMTNINSVGSNYGMTGLPPDVALEEQALNRKQQIANLLLQRGLQGAQGQMAGRFYVPPSWAQGLAQLGSAAAGATLSSDIDSQRQGLAATMNKERERAIQDYIKRTSPTETQPEMAVDSTLVPNTFDIEQLQPDQQREQVRQQNQNAYANSAAPSEIASGALTDKMNAMGQMTPDPQMSMPDRSIPVGAPVQAPADPRQSRQAVLDALSHADPRVRSAVTFLEQMKAQESEKEAARAFQGVQNEENRAARREGIEANALMRLEQMKQNAALLEMNIASKEQMGQNAEASKRQLAEYNAAIQKELHRIDAQSRETVAKIGADAKVEAAGVKAGAKGKLPAAIGSKFMENSQNLRMAENALDLIGKHRDATGIKGYLPDPLLQRIDPSGVDTRAAVANLGSMVIHDRSGAAVTASEFPRLRPFIPSATDSPDVVKKKLTQFVTEYKKINQEMTDFYRESGYDIPENWHQAGGSGQSTALPEGAKQIGTSGGKPVYQLPDGSKVIAE